MINFGQRWVLQINGASRFNRISYFCRELRWCGDVELCLKVDNAFEGCQEETPEDSVVGGFALANSSDLWLKSFNV